MKFTIKKGKSKEVETTPALTEPPLRICPLLNKTNFMLKYISAFGAVRYALEKVMPNEDSTQGGLVDKVVKIKRCAAVVKGGRRFSFAAMVVVGDGSGRVAWGYGKANEVPPAVDKAVKDGTQKLKSVRMSGTTIPHEVIGRFGAAKVVLVPASPGTGVIAGAAVRAVCEACGIRDILTKSYGTSNSTNVVKATIAALMNLRTQNEIEQLRGVSLT